MYNPGGDAEMEYSLHMRGFIFPAAAEVVKRHRKEGENMKIELTKIRYGEDETTYKYKPFSYCCEKIKENDGIIFTNEDFVDNDFRDEYDDTPRFCVTITERISSYEDSWDETRNYPIEYCPHCGEKIEISVVREMDMTEEVTRLRKEREEMLIKSNVTDSKKEERELKEKVRAYDRKIRWYYDVTEWEEKKDE